MEKNFDPAEPLPEKPSAKVRRPWKRSTVELNGRFEPDYRHELYSLLTHSYSEIREFLHLYNVGEEPCPTHTLEVRRLTFDIIGGVDLGHPLRKQGVSGLEFDSKYKVTFADLFSTFEKFARIRKHDRTIPSWGTYVVSVTRSGCLTVHDFESLYCQTKVRSNSVEDESKHLAHFSLPRELEPDVVRWNPSKQNEVACASFQSNEVLIFDVTRASSRLVEVLQAGDSHPVLGWPIHRGLCDIAFTTGENSRVLSSDTYGVVSVWDRRLNFLPCIELSTKGNDTINSIQINEENQIIFGADKEGFIHTWDLRGGRTSSAFQSHKEASHLPRASLRLATMLQKIGSPKAQSKIVPKEVYSIDLNPFRPYQLAFHLVDGWSGVLDIHRSEVTHVHCPPPSPLGRCNTPVNMLNVRKPSWLPTSSIYVVGSMYKKGIHFLDFHPSSSSPCHVDYDEDSQRNEETRQRCKRNNRFLRLSEGVTVCAAHPLNGTIMAGTQRSSLVLVSQKHHTSESESKS